MPIISAGIVSRQGRILLSRQFTDISRIRVEGLLSAFPSLLDSQSAGGKHCTYLETGSVRYVYQPVESLFLVLITTKSSNIVEDLDTLRLMGRLVAGYCFSVTEAAIVDQAYEILFAFDEVVVGGHRDSNTLEDIKLYLEMHSNEEVIYLEEKHQQEEAARKAADLHRKQMERNRGSNPYGGIGSGGGGGGMGGSDDGQHHLPMHQQASTPTYAAVDVPEKRPAGGGMTLGKARKTDVASKIQQESRAHGGGASAAPAAAAASTQAQASPDQQQAIHLRVDERMSAALNRDGGIVKFEVKGELSIHIADAQLSNVRILMKPYNTDFAFMPFPTINKDKFLSDRVLSQKEGKVFKTHQTVPVVRWRSESGSAPLTVLCWPTGDSASIQYELTDPNVTLYNVSILIPIAGAEPSVEDSTGGDVSVQGEYVQWVLPVINADNKSGSIEFTFPEEVADESYFPIQIGFNAPNVSLARMVVSDVVNAENGMPVAFSTACGLTAEDYIVA